MQDSAEEIESEPTPEGLFIQGMRFIHISAGAFQMGSPESENGVIHPNDSAEVAIEWEEAFQVTLTNDYFYLKQVTEKFFINFLRMTVRELAIACWMTVLLSF